MRRSDGQESSCVEAVKEVRFYCSKISGDDRFVPSALFSSDGAAGVVELKVVNHVLKRL